MSEENEEKELKIYELGYLLPSRLAEEEVGREYGKLKELIANSGGEMVSDEIPKKISLAYTMQKVVANVRERFDTAYFGWIKFVMDTPYRKPFVPRKKEETTAPINKEEIDKEIEAMVATEPVTK